MNADGLALALGLGDARGAKALARAVKGAKQRVVVLSDVVGRALAQAGHAPERANLQHGKLPLEDASADALCASGLGQAVLTSVMVRECARVVRGGGHVHLATSSGIVGRGPDRHLVTALFMHAGLVDIEQQLARGTAITTGRVRR
jgi:hypothetical protein